MDKYGLICTSVLIGSYSKRKLYQIHYTMDMIYYTNNDDDSRRRCTN